MKSKLALNIALVALIFVALTSPAAARKPLVGDMDLQFNLGWTEPNETIPVWVGTIAIDGEVYGMAFFNTGTGRPFSDQPNDNVAFFEETWTIYDFETFDFSFGPDGTLTSFEPGDIVLSGYDRGVVSLANGKYRMNGSVEVAEGEFSEWLDRRVHMSGNVEFYPFGAPRFAPGTFRIN